MDTGVYRWGQLREQASRREIDEAIRDGRLIRLRHGWYATRAADPRVVRAVAAGGVVSCASALDAHGVWVPPSRRLHIRGNDARSRTRRDWCRCLGRQPAEDGAVDGIPTALRHAAVCLPTEDFIVVCDSVLHLRLVTPAELADLFSDAPRRIVDALGRCDGRAESGTETMVRVRLTSRRPRLRVRPQAYIDGVGRVDLLIGDALIVEVDGYAYHSDPETFESDRLRDLRARLVGYAPVRLTFAQVVYRWEVVEPLLAQLIARGDHRRRRR
ncbi:hypothetical protein [Gordonia shandongensis]|uniref:hypothetical protein n=1 Tax=Gordonia shandongensis TaxID=376351 RepID=UPI000429D599|nr:hypothetical protein [Gordonia shandongensis]